MKGETFMPVNFREYPIIKGEDAKRFLYRRNKVDKSIKNRVLKARKRYSKV